MTIRPTSMWMNDEEIDEDIREKERARIVLRLRARADEICLPTGERGTPQWYAALALRSFALDLEAEG